MRRRSETWGFGAAAVSRASLHAASDSPSRAAVAEWASASIARYCSINLAAEGRQRGAAAAASARLSGDDGLAKAVVHIVNKEPCPAIRHAKRDARLGDRSGVTDRLQQAGSCPDRSPDPRRDRRAGLVAWSPLGWLSSSPRSLARPFRDRSLRSISSHFDLWETTLVRLTAARMARRGSALRTGRATASQLNPRCRCERGEMPAAATAHRRAAARSPPPRSRHHPLPHGRSRRR